MNFTLFGIDVEIEFSFWLSCILFSYRSVDTSKGLAGLLPVLIWTVVLFVSILVHEYGHALAIRRHRIQPEITLHFMGGKTTWRALLPLRRIDQVIISLAGPFAGFLLAAVIYGVTRNYPHVVARLPEPVQDTIAYLLFANVGWGIFNLLPVLPLDGGHVLEHALGPKRIRITATISMVVGGVAALFFLRLGSFWAAYIMGLGAFQSLRILQAGGVDIDASDIRPRAPAAEPEAMISGEIRSILSRARQAVTDQDFAKARTLCNELLARAPEAENATPSNARREALEILAWADLGDEKLDDAASKIEEAKRLGDLDAALVGAVLFAKRDLKEARRVLEAARSNGDERKEVLGPLIQILIEQGEVARAAAIAYDIVDSLSEDDARRMAQLAFEHAAFDWSARLYEAACDRQKQPEDAYEAARAHAQDGAYDRATEMLEKAVAAGFNDRTRAWSDKALEALRARNGLEALVPRP
ncbi:MAG TPA: site-2 protease family protein [Polyangium sp.]|nr:site-2 protease family protein [Polyangium sp.]